MRISIIFFLAYAVVSLQCSSSRVRCPFQHRLPCFVVFGVVNFEFQNLTQQYSPDTLVFRATNIDKNLTENHFVSSQYFKVWDIEEVDRNTDYKLSLIKVADELLGKPEKVLWRYEQVFTVHKDLFYCYYNERHSHENPFNPRPRVFDINHNGTSLGVQWSINHWDEEYNFIEYHEIRALHQGEQVFSSRHEQSTTCKNKLCKSSAVTGLQPCQKYTLCVHTKFKLSTCVAHQCLNVTTPACHHPRPRTNYIVAGLAGSVLLLVVMMGFVVCWRLKRVVPGTRKSGELNFEADDFIQPRDCTYQDIPYGVGPEHLYSQILAL